MIVFKSVSYRNFLSAGNIPIVISLNSHNMTLISGKNGCGKSLIQDAICFGLFGRAYRNLNKPLLINSINQKQLVVEVQFSIGKKNFKIVRGMKPNIFEIWDGDKMINQDPNIKDYQKVLEQQILQMNYRAFTQVVIMGSGSYVPFMKLLPKDRREFIEDLLDIRVFSVMNNLLKDKIKNTKEQVKDIETEMKMLREKIRLHEEFIAKRKADQQSTNDSIHIEIQELESESIKHQGEIETLQEQVDRISSLNEKFSSAPDVLSELQLSYRNIKKAVIKSGEEKEFYTSIEDCPQCKQTIGDEHKTHIIRTVEERISLNEKELVKLDESIKTAEEVFKKWSDSLAETDVLNKEISRLNRLIIVNSALIKSKHQIVEKALTDTTSFDESKRALRELAKTIVAKDKQRRQLNESIHYQTASSALLQDTGIKAKIIKQYIPVINKLVNKYLDALEFFVSFNLNENFEEEVKSRHRDMFKYDSFSEGQKLRIDIALLFAWRDVAKLKNSVNSSLVFFDELFDSSLDGVGMDLVMGLLTNLKNTNTIVISHRDAIADKFDHVITVGMKNNFSIIE